MTKGGSLSRHKKTHFGCLPGDVPKHVKIEMLEKGTDRESISPDAGKTYKKIVVRKAQRRTRRNAPAIIRASLEET